MQGRKDRELPALRREKREPVESGWSGEASLKKGHLEPESPQSRGHAQKHRGSGRKAGEPGTSAQAAAVAGS